MANRTVSVNLVANIGQYVSGMNTAAGATLRLGESATASTKKAQGGFELAGKSALVMGGAVVGGLAMAISKSMDFEKSMSAVGAATQASSSTLMDLRAAAMKAGADTAYSATEAADGITEMAKAGVSAKDIMGGGLTGALSLAAAGQIDVAEAAGIAATAMTQFSLSGRDLPHVADLLAAGAGKAMGSVDDLGQALNQAGLVASASGMSIEETTGTLAAFASAGLLGSDAGTSMKTMLQKLQAPSKEAAGLMSELGINMYDANGNMLGMAEMAGQLQTHLSKLTQEERNAALATIFGSDAVRAANVLYSEGAQGIAKWTGKVNDSGYAAKQAAALQDNLRGDLEKLGGSFDTLMIQMGSGAQGPLRELVQMFTGLLDGIGWAVDAFSSLPTPVMASVGAMAALAALRGPMAGFLTTVQVNSVLAANSLLGLLGSATTVRAALMSLMGAAAPFAAVASIAYAAVKTYEFATAAGDARQEIRGMWSAVADARGVEQINALSEYVGHLEEKVRGLNEELPKTKGAFQGLLAPAGMLENGGTLNAVNEYEKALLRARDAQERTGTTATGLAERLHLTKQEVLDLAEKYDVDLTGNATKAAQLFEYMYAKEYGTGPVDAANATGSAMTSAKARTEEAAKAIEDWINDLMKVGEAFVEPLGLYKGLLQEAAQKTADATKSSKDSWQDYADSATVSLDQFATKLQEQITNQENWRANLVTVAQRAGYDVAQQLATMGQEGVRLTAQMANGTDAEMLRMADLLRRDAALGGAGAASALDTQMKVMAAIGRDGAGATVAGIAQQLGIGVGQVADIARQYGVTLAAGINPLLVAVGKGRIPALNGQRVPDFYDGGFTGPGGKYTPAGIVHKGEFVMPQEAVDRIGVSTLGAMAGLPGYAGGGYVLPGDVPRPRSTAPFQIPLSTGADGTMSREYDEVSAFVAAHPPEPPAASGGSSSGLIPIMAAARQYVMDTYGIRNIGGFANRNIAGTNVKSDHAMGKAIDIMTTNLGLGWQIANDFAFGPAHGRFRAENVIWQQSISSNGGRFVGMADRGSPTQNHRDHVHVDTYQTGTPYVPRDGLAYLHEGEAVVPASINARSREFSGGGGGRGGGSVSVAPAQVTVHFHVDGQEFRGMTRTEIASALGDVTSGLASAGVRP